MDGNSSRARQFEPVNFDGDGHSAPIRDNSPKQTRSDLDVRLVLAGSAVVTVAWIAAVVWGAAKLVQDLFG
jgi:hypothetical protein